MPRARSRKNTAVEVLPPEEADQSQAQVREVKHKTEWVELRPVEGVPEDADAEIEDVEIEDRQPRRKTPKTERDELRKKLAANNVTPASNLKLTIEKYSHSEVMDGAGGMSGDTEHCTKYPCVESHITNEDYLDVARAKWGAGMYRFTLRMQNKIVTAWDKRISGGMAGTVIQQTNPADPNSPHVIVQMPEGPQQPMPIADPFKEAERALNFMKKYNEAFGAFRPQAAENPARSEEEIIAGAIIKQPAVIESVVESIIKRVGVKNGESDEPWWAGVLKDSITTGQLAPTVQGIVKALFPNGLFGGLSNMFTGGQNNGQAPMAQTPVQDQAQPGHQQQSQLVSGQEVGQVATPTNSPGNVEGDVSRSGNAQMVARPEEEALRLLIDHCQREVPVKIAFDRLIGYADLLNEQAPWASIDPYLEAFAATPVEAALEFVKSQPNGEQVVSLPHAKDWCTELQRLIKEAGQEGEE